MSPSFMGMHHGQGSDARLIAKMEGMKYVYDPSFYKEARVYQKDRRYAMLVVDMLEDFIFGSLKCDRMVPKVPNVGELVESCRSNGIPVIYCNDSHKETDFELRRWDPHAMRGTKGAEVIRDVKPKSSDVVVPKSTYSCFHDTELDDVLRSQYDGKGANTLVLAGLHTDCCVRHTTADAFFRRYEVTVIDDAVDAFSDIQQKVGLQYLRYWYLATIDSTKQFVKAL